MPKDSRLNQIVTLASSFTVSWKISPNECGDMCPEILKTFPFETSKFSSYRLSIIEASIVSGSKNLNGLASSGMSCHFCEIGSLKYSEVFGEKFSFAPFQMQTYLHPRGF